MPETIVLAHVHGAREWVMGDKMGDVIVLDTNAVHDLDPHGSQADLIRMLRKAGLKITVPWVTLEELTAHKLYDYQRAFGLMLNRHEELERLEPNLSGPAPVFQGEKFAAYWRNQYMDVFAIIPTKPSALQAAVLREAACMKPAKVEKNAKSGGRDVALWFSILDYMDANPDEKVYLVTNNTKDFGEPGTWHFPLNIDLAGKSDRIEQFLDFQDALREFTKEEEVPGDAAETLTRRLQSPESIEIVTHEAWKSLAPKRARRLPRNVPSGVRLKVGFESMGPVECRRIGTSLWYWAKATWQVYMCNGGVDVFTAAWDTSILFSENPETPISVLRNGRLTQIPRGELGETLAGSLAEGLMAYGQEVETDRHSAQLRWVSEDFTALDRQRRQFAARRHTEPALYERQVIQALREFSDDVERVSGPGDFGVDAMVGTPEGSVIAVSIKAGSGIFGLNRLIQALSIPAELGDAVLIVTSRSISRNVDHEIDDMLANDPRPVEIVCWADESDTITLMEKVMVLRRRISES
ncbi:PIN domain-containing protein [Streptomyces sp. NPDC048357]|uniref:PIN domain-containing protein n=1 Tax=Streptomyces sp. NPDC048357 TaxID=3154719 RepID=UPI00343DE86D